MFIHFNDVYENYTKIKFYTFIVWIFYRMREQKTKKCIDRCRLSGPFFRYSDDPKFRADVVLRVLRAFQTFSFGRRIPTICTIIYDCVR